MKGNVIKMNKWKTKFRSWKKVEIFVRKKGKKNTYRTVVSCGTFGMAVKWVRKQRTVRWKQLQPVGQ